MKPIILALLCLCLCGCRTAKECNLVELQRSHPEELKQVFDEHPALMMDMFKRITTLEQEAGGYR